MIEPENVSQIVSGRLGDGWGTALEAVRSIAKVLEVPKSDIFWRVVTMRKREWKLETDRMEIVTTDAGTYVKGKLDSLKK